MKKSILKVVSFVLAVVLIFLSMSSLLRYRYSDSITSIKNFYRQPENSIDVISLGSSHVYEGICPAVLYEEYGIAAYDLCAPAQEIWSTYHYFVEALKTQKPNAVVLDVYMLNGGEDYDSVAGAIKSTYGMKWSENRVEALKAAFSEDDYKMLKYPFYQYHSRYAELQDYDILKDNANSVIYGDSYKGFKNGNVISAVKRPEIVNINETRELSDKKEEYFRKIIELAIEKNIKLYVISLPYILDRYNQITANSAGKIVEEYNNSLVQYIDFNRLYDNIGIDFERDFSGKQHLNYFGAVKFTSYLGNILTGDLNFTDRRNDENYSSWKENAETFYRLYDGCYYKWINNFNEYVFALNGLDDDYLVAAVINSEMTDKCFDSISEDYDLADVVNDDFDIFSDENIKIVQNRIKIIKNYENVIAIEEALGLDASYPQGSVWIMENGEFKLYDSAENECRLYVNCSRTSDAAIESNKKETDDGIKYVTTVKYNNADYTCNTNGVTFLIYDKKTGTFIDAVGFSSVNDLAKRK